MKLELKNPVSPISINQVFGVNKATYVQFGLNGHNGLDLRALHGQPVYASHDGVANYEVDSSQGHGVDLQGTVEVSFGAYSAYPETRYWHLCDPKKEPLLKSPIYGKKNVKVKAGDLIGYADSTGFSTGDHLHFGLKPQGKNSKGVYYKLLPNNGFLGAIDPRPFLAETMPSGTSVPYEEALTNIYRANLPAPIRLMAVAILKAKYAFVDKAGKGSDTGVQSSGMSQTYLASALALLTALLPLFGLEVADSEVVSQNLLNIFTGLFALWAIFRRVQVGDISWLGIRKR